MSEKIATREAYGKALVELGASNDKIVVLDADLAGATMTKFFKAAYPCLLYTSPLPFAVSRHNRISGNS